MKTSLATTLICLAAVLIPALSFGQRSSSWTVKVNKKTILSASIESEKANLRKLKQSEWKKNGYLEVAYRETPVKKGWSRSIFLVDENDNDLLRKDSVSNFKVSLAELRKTFAGSSRIKIYTTSIPLDPELAARARVRRVHLCTIEL